MKNLRRLALLSAITLMSVSAVQASNIGGKPWAPSSFSASKWSSTFRTTYDSYTVQASFQFNTTHRAALQSAAQANGWKFTQEMNDYPTDHLNTCSYGTGTIDWSTNMPNPAHDLDDDDGDRKCEEAEVTADSTAFPTANYGYVFRQEFTRWYGMPPYWFWDSSSGTIVHVSQMSYWFIEWQAADWTSNYASTSYPTKSAPAGAAAATVDEGPTERGSVDSAVASPDGAIDVALAADGLAIAVDATGSETDILVTRAPDVGLREYVKGGHRRALQAIKGGGPYDVVVTFAEPLSPSEFARITSVPGINVDEFEAIGTLNGYTWTYGGGPDGVQDLRTRFEADGVTFSGIVSVIGTLSDRSAYEALRSMDSVLLVDFAPALARQLAAADAGAAAAIGSDSVDTLVNDIYWDHAGITQ